MFSLQSDSAFISLQRRWWLVVASWFSVLLCVYWLLQQIWPIYAERWLLIAGLVMTYGPVVLRRALAENHRQNETALLPTFGLGSGLTLLRGLAIGLIAGFLFSPWPPGGLAWLPALLYAIAAAADFFDGYVARVTNHATRLGARLDMEFDGLGMLVVSGLAVWYGQLPWWYLGLGLARYLFVFGMWWRCQWGLPVYEIPPSVHRRVFAGFQMGFMSFVLWPIFPAAGVTIAGVIFAIPSALSFLRDWLVASGRLDPLSLPYRQVQRNLAIATTKWLPLLLRFSVCLSILLVALALDNPIQPAAWMAVLQGWGLPLPGLLATLLSLVAVTSMLMVTFGALARLSSLALVAPVAVDIIGRGLHWPNGVALAALLSILLLGSGAFSLWRPEEWYVMRRAGERTGS